MYVDKSKHQSRPRYLVVIIDGEWCMVRKFVGNSLRQLSYRIKQSECYKVAADLTAPKLNPAKEEENEDDDTTPAPEPTTMYYKHLVSPTRDHQMTTMITEPRQDESYTNPITLEPNSTTPELHYDETPECTQQENPVQPETNQMEVTTQHSQSEHVLLRRATRIRKRPTFYPH